MASSLLWTCVKKTCGCKQWEMNGIPCAHAVCAIPFDCGEPEDYVHQYYSLEMYKKAYAPLIYPMLSEEQWVYIVRHDILESPRPRVAPGRPRKLRRRGPDESRDSKNPDRMWKFGARMRCSKCRVLGHNKRACPLNRYGSFTQASQSVTKVKCPTQPAASVS
jgi:zinc finger SWIM domain-containing protein 3